MSDTVYIQSPNGQAKTLAVWQNARQIAQGLKDAEYNSRPVSKQLATVFKVDNDLVTAARVWLWLRKNIDYEAEPEEDQTAAEIPVIVAKKQGDCKHYATFAVGVLNACGIPAWFSYAGQDRTKRKPNHVYASAVINGKVVTIDPCRKRFNSECRYYYKWDVPPKK